MRLFALILGSLVCTCIVLLTVRFWGLGQSYLPYDNHFFDAKGPWLVVPWDTPEAARDSRAQDWVLWANVYRQKPGGVLLVAPSADEPHHVDRGLAPDPSRPLLSDFLKGHPSQRIVLNILDNADEIQTQVDEVLKSSEGPNLAKERFIIESDYNNVLTSLKELEPRLVYGSTVADLMRLKSYDALGVVAAAPFKGDVFISGLTFVTDSPRAGVRSAVNEDIAQEMHRRLKKLILGPITTRAEYDQAVRLGADGIISSKPEEILSWQHGE